MVLGEPKSVEIRRLKDMNIREKIMFAPLAVLVIYIGLLPNYLLKVTESSVIEIVKKEHGELK